jgi:molybdopterin molybdotransferase
VLDRVARAPRPALEIENLPLEHCDGRVLAAPVFADRDYPPTARSVRDGFAVRAADLPGPLRVIGEARAGLGFRGSVGPGEAVEIMTGAPVPAGADAVIMVEYSRREGEFVTFDRTVPAGDAINPQGWEAAGGTPLLEPGLRLDYARLATLAMTGHAAADVYRQLRAGILPTGDEVIEVTGTPTPEQVRNSNAWSLAAQVRRAGAFPVMLGIARDEYHDTRTRLEMGFASCDLVLLSGGVSAGKYDIVEKVLAGMGAEFYFDRVKIQPGQPLVFGTARGKLFFGLPGNPASTMVTFEVFARAAIDLLAGQTSTSLTLLSARLTREFRQRPGLTRFLPASLAPDRAEVTPIAWRGSGDIPSLARADCFLVSDPERERYDAGETIRVMPK